MTTSTAVELSETRHLRPSARMRAKFFRELAALGLASRPRDRSIVTEADLERLPLAAQRYMRFMHVLEHPRDASFRMRWEGRFRMGPNRAWVPCEVWQYNTSAEVARIFHMRMNFAGVVPTYVRDLYVHGGGHMAGKLLGLIGIGDDASEKVTIGELVTYLNDAVIFAPSMLLGPSTTWAAVDDGTFDVSLVDAGHTVTARVFVDVDGAMFNFSTTDRFGEDPTSPGAGLVRTEWTTPVDGWQCVGDRMRPTSARAIWHYPSGDHCYVELTSARMELQYNVPPG